MKYLDQRFEEVNKRLDIIIDLQLRTLKALEALTADQRAFQVHVLHQLDRIENTVLGNQQLLEAVLLSQWRECGALVNRSLNGELKIPTRKVLADVLRDRETPRRTERCYSTMIDFLDDSVLSAKWAGQIIDADAFPADVITPDKDLQRVWKAFQSQQGNAYRYAKDFALEGFDGADAPLSARLARLEQPVLNVKTAKQLDATIARDEVHTEFSNFKCDQTDVLIPALRKLLCFGSNDSDSVPLDGRWKDLLQSSLIGPQYTVIINKGITLATIADFAERTESGSFVFVKPVTIERFSKDGTTPDLRMALKQRKGLDLLERLQWLAEANVLQQSISYGDYIAKLVENALYDPATKSLNTDKKVIEASPIKQNAVKALRANPLLARNVDVGNAAFN